jgi:hypothetical protein
MTTALVELFLAAIHAANAQDGVPWDNSPFWDYDNGRYHIFVKTFDNAWFLAGGSFSYNTAMHMFISQKEREDVYMAALAKGKRIFLSKLSEDESSWTSERIRL